MMTCEACYKHIKKGDETKIRHAGKERLYHTACWKKIK